jgi:hypothetical protein
MVKEPSKAPQRSSSSGDVFTTIKELNELIKKYTGDDDDCDDNLYQIIYYSIASFRYLIKMESPGMAFLISKV